MYIYDEEKWPQFRWDYEKVSSKLFQLRHLQGRLIGGMESIGFHLSDEVFLRSLTLDVVKSSEIEGEILDQTLVRSSVARHLGIEHAALPKIDQHIEGIVEMTLDATQNFDQPLTQERIFRWHIALFPEGRSGFKPIAVGCWRKGPVDVVSGRSGREVVHFEAPHADRVDGEMRRFLSWFNDHSELDPVLKGGIAHLWFVTIHPFEDGNGRIARAIGDLMLARSEKSSKRFYSLSTQIQKERKDYYHFLEKTQKDGLDITPWVTWFLGCLHRAIDAANSSFSMILNKAKFWEKIAQIPLNPRQKKILNCLLEGFEGKLTTSKWAKMAKCSQDTAYRDILELIDYKILRKNPEGGRSTSYSLFLE